MDADVYWAGRLIGRLLDVRFNQPYYEGTWVPAGDSAFENAYRDLQARIAPNGLGAIPVVFRAPDESMSAPAALVVRPNTPEPYFRYRGGELDTGSDPIVVHKPRVNRTQ
jgi:hypothetical protein